MVRVLVVHQPTEDFENRELAVALAAAGSADYDVRLFQLPPAGATPHAMAELARLDRAAGFDVLHAIGPNSLLSVLPIGCQPVVYTPIAHNILRGVRRLRWISKVRQVTSTAPSQSARRALIDVGINQASIRSLPTPFVPTPAQTPITRKALGLAESDRVMLAVGECTRAAGHKLSAWAAVILFCFDQRHKLLIAGGPYVDVIRRFTQALCQPGFCVIAQDVLNTTISFDHLVPMADLALYTPAEPGGLLAAEICRAGNLPILAAPSALTNELSRDDLIIGPAVHAKLLAQTAHHFFDDDPNRPTRRGQAILHPVNGLDDWLQLYDDVLVGRQRPFAKVT